MSQVIHGQGETAQTLAELYSPIREELAQVEEILRCELASKHKFVDRLVKHGFRLGGKRLRPALVLLAGKACGNISKDHLTLAAAMELIHTATLIHDDVLDEASMRRHLDTVNARWDNEASVLLGDYLLARSIGLVGTVDTTFACEVIGTASREMCEGELRQIGARGNYDLKEIEYLEIIGDKTAALCACCCRLGAHYAAGTDEKTQQSLARYGRHLGLAFQVVDDVLDVSGDEATMGKSLGTDLVKQKATLPLIRLLEKADKTDRAKLMDILSDSENHRKETLAPWFAKYDAIEYSRQKAVELTHLAAAELDALPKGPIIDTLRRLAKFVVSRRQ